jgi:hypothetical protein
VNFIEIFLLVVLVVRAQVPLILGGDRRLVQHKCEQRRLLVRVHQALDYAQRPGECILLRSSGVIGDLELRSVLGGAVVDICIAAL